MMFKKLFLGALTVCSLGLSSFSVNALQNPFTDSLQQNRFPPVEQVFLLDYSQIDAELRVRFNISDGFYLYQHRFNFTPEDKVNRMHPLPLGENHSDEFFGDTIIYREQVELIMDLNATVRNEVLNVHFQGCADDGFCYPPSVQKIFLRRTDGVSNGQSTETVEATNSYSRWLPLGAVLIIALVLLFIRRGRKKQ